MKWIIIAGAGLLAIVVIITVIGALLPRDHVAALTARIAATPDTVWHTITNVAGHTAWRPDVGRVEVLAPSDKGPSWREHSRHGVITMVVERWEPPRHLVTRIADVGLPFAGRWEYRIEPDGAGASQVTITERGTVHNPIFRFVSRFVMGHTATIDGYLRALGRKFGAEPTPAVVATAAGSGG